MPAIDSYIDNPTALILKPGIQHYGWGDPDFIPARFGYDNPDNRPFAEVWMGAHPERPATVTLDNDTVSLRDVIDAAPEVVLGHVCAAAYGELPFLFKVLCAAKPLSIQVHPNQQQAAAGFAREKASGVPLDARHRNYKDDNHKCEMSVAVTDTYLVAGFRPVAEIAQNLELFTTCEAWPDDLPVLDDSTDSIRMLFAALMTLPQGVVNAIIDTAVATLARNRNRYTVDDWQYWVVQADAEFARDGGRTRDRGVFAIPFLQLIHLKPLQGVYLPACMLHAYLLGNVIELMANSNNVLRSGLTPKHIDVDELLNVVDFAAGGPAVIDGIKQGAMLTFETPVHEFKLSYQRLEAGAEQIHTAGDSAEILLILTGNAETEVQVSPDGAAPQTRRGSTSVFVPSGATCMIRTDAEATLFRATAGSDQPSAGSRVARIKNNIALARRLVETGETPEIIGTVSGSASAQRFWQSMLDRACTTLKARTALSFHEDLPVNQAFGILLLWQRLREHVSNDRGSLVAFVFGEGTRATPFTETDNAQKPAIATYVTTPTADGHRYLSMVELAMYYRVPVQQYLRRSGFHGLVIQWGDEVQIPSCDLSTTDASLQHADIVRFVSMRKMTEEFASQKDWVGVDAGGRVTAFIPRRSLIEMVPVADRGLLQRRADDLYGGINLGSIAVSYALLDALLEEFAAEVNDAGANRKQRPDLDPQFFTALCIAVIDNDEDRGSAWRVACDENAAMAKLQDTMPDILPRLRRVVEQFETTNNRKLKMQAMDFGEPFWGDIGQHPQIYTFYTTLNEDSEEGEIARAIAGIADVARDAGGNLVVNSEIGPGIAVTNSVLINATLTGSGTVSDSVLIGTRAHDIRAAAAFDVGSTVRALRLAPRSGTYKVVSTETVDADVGERYTTLFMPTHGTHLVRVDENSNLRDRASSYDVAILGNAVSFREAHEDMGRLGIDELAAARAAAEDAVLS